SPQEIWHLSEKHIRSLKLPKDVQDSLIINRKKIDLAREMAEIGAANIKIITIADDNYPPLLKEIYDPPTVLYIRGGMQPNSAKIAVVGTRLMTTYGHQVTETLTEGLIAAGLTVVSGLARGVDALSHRVSLRAGGQTIAVLGSGLNKIYPPENRSLAEEIATSGAVISEYHPDAEAGPGTFPARNRIISGLCLGVLVTEAGEDSGSLITANSALDQGRLVFSVPGPVNSKQSVGTNGLIKAGAKLVTDIQDLLEDLNMDQNISTREMAPVKPANLVEEKILKELSTTPTHVD